MFKWLRGLGEEKTKPIAADANRIVAKSSERGEPPCDADPIEELVRIAGEAHDDRRSRNVADDCLTNGRSASRCVPTIVTTSTHPATWSTLRPAVASLKPAGGSRLIRTQVYVTTLAVIWVNWTPFVGPRGVGFKV